LRRQYSERRVNGEVVHVEAAPGIVTVVASWMLDPAVCAGLGFGAPRVAIAALVDLHDLLTILGFRLGCFNQSGLRQAHLRSGNLYLLLSRTKPHNLCARCCGFGFGPAHGQLGFEIRAFDPGKHLARGDTLAFRDEHR
jgi:hypothetical protein